MKPTHEEILNALEVIKKTCANYQECEFGCPFHAFGCRITENCPEYWEIMDEEINDVWRCLE